MTKSLPRSERLRNLIQRLEFIRRDVLSGPQGFAHTIYDEEMKMLRELEGELREAEKKA